MTMTLKPKVVFFAVFFFLGIGEGRIIARPIRPPGPGVEISGSRFGRDFYCGVEEDGTVRCWGNNDLGELGNGTTGGQQPSPGFVQVSANGVASNLGSVVAVSAGSSHVCALLADSSMRCWGNNGNGQLGNGESGGTRSLAVPVKITIGILQPNLTGVKAIAAGGFHTCALLTDGTIRCWGNNFSGQLGDGSTGRTIQINPVQVAGIFNAVAIAAGVSHTCAVLSDGTMRCWGSNSVGQLGVGTTGGTQPLPTLVRNADNTALLTNVAGVTAGQSHTCALLADGTAVCWGTNSANQLGNGNVQNSNLPVAVDGLSNISSISAGSQHTCALTADGLVRCWGINGSGRLGLDPGISSQPTPPAASISGLGGVLAIAAGTATTCAFQSNETIQCWGSDTSGALGNDLPLADSSVPVAVNGSAGAISGRAVAAGDQHTCVPRANSTIACWGKNLNGQLGSNGTSDNPNPTSVKTLSTRTLPFQILTDLTGNHMVSGGGSHTCALGASGSVRCWGSNGSGQLGTGDNDELHLAPNSPIANLTNVVSIATGQSHSCAVLASGKVMCWGANDQEQLGHNSSTDSFTTPVAVRQFIPSVGGLGSLEDLANIVMVTAGIAHTCALRVDGEVFCWGDNSKLQLGRFIGGGASSAGEAVADLSNVVAIAAGARHTCALISDGGVKCWGENDRGQLGNVSVVNSTRAVTVLLEQGAGNPVELSNIVSIAAGGKHTCAIRNDGKAFCWGDNPSGQLGFGNFDGKHLASAPVKQVSIQKGFFDLTGLVSLELGIAHSCALRVDGQPFCWGDNGNGELGDGTNTGRAFAAAVPSFTFNIVPNVELKNNQRVTVVTALANCPAGSRVHFDVNLTQGDASGSGHGEGTCVGGLSTYSVNVPAQGRFPFQPGAATAQAHAEIKDHGQIIDVQDWTRAVELSFAP